jgi:predicted signal transduction protein with EAL and GGDEF domain
MGEWVLREACREAAPWPRKLDISINLSPIQFRRGDLCALLHEGHGSDCFDGRFRNWIEAKPPLGSQAPDRG